MMKKKKIIINKKFLNKINYYGVKKIGKKMLFFLNQKIQNENNCF